MSAETPSAQWAVVELFGHKMVAGQAQKDESFGWPMLRVDVPAVEGIPAFSDFYSEKAIYGVHPVSEAVARATAARLKHTPILVYMPELVTREQYDELKEETERLRLRKGLPAPETKEDDDDIHRY